MTTILEEFGMKPQPKGEVGIEIEMEGQNLFHRVKDWVVEEDGSLRGESAEYVLRHPCPRTHVSKLLSGLQEALSGATAVLSPSERCGVHVHINCQNLTTDQVINFVILYLIFEEPMVKWCGPDREGNLFSLRAKDAEYQIEGLRWSKMEGTLRGMQDNTYRYASVNLTAIGKYGSLEFRAMRTPKDFSSILTWVNMLLAIKDKSLEFSEARNIVEGISNTGAKEFSRQVLGDYYELIECPRLDRMIMEGVRRVQEIAYASVLQNKKAPAKKKKGNYEDYVVQGLVQPRFEYHWKNFYIHDHRVPQETIHVYRSPMLIDYQDQIAGNYIIYHDELYKWGDAGVGLGMRWNSQAIQKNALAMGVEIPREEPPALPPAELPEPEEDEANDDYLVLDLSPMISNQGNNIGFWEKIRWEHNDEEDIRWVPTEHYGQRASDVLLKLEAYNAFLEQIA